MDKKFTEYGQLNLSDVNKEVLKAWDEKDVFTKSMTEREGCPSFVFYEGPPSANGMPGIHHVMARTIKDVFCRYKTMKGFQVKRKAGWDTHGLPVELGVEKAMGITKEDIGKTISVADYNAACRKDVMKFTEEWTDLTHQMGYWVDLDDPYITYDNRYIETLWWLLKQLYNKGLLYKGYTIQPYSPAAGTGLSSHELNQPGCYRDVKDTTVVGQFRMKNPKPEMEDAYGLCYEYAEKTDADIIITTDPDCDRLGVAVKQNGKYVRMTGNQSAAVLLEYILSRKTADGTLPKNGVMFNTVVTSDIGDKICAEYGVVTEKTLTGFKFIGDKIYQHELAGDREFVFGYEESYGCLISPFVRDKDAVQASLMLCEAAAYYHQNGKTLIDVLWELYAKHGFYLDALDNFAFKGIDGPDRMKALLNSLRNDPPKSAAGIAVATMEDYESEVMISQGFPSSNVLRFILEDGSWVAVRPSGTEPKCKFYFSIRGEDKAAAEAKLPEIKKAFERV